MSTVRTTCPYCGVGCGIRATATAPREVTIAGDGEHPANRGKLCSKGTHLGETVGLEGRLLHPMIGERQVRWEEALGLVAQRFADTIAEHGPDSVAFYVSGQLLTEDYYAANKLMKGFIGSGNIDTNSRLCMASAVAAQNRAFGEDVVPVSYDDIDEADLIVLVGSNTAWCHPVVWQRVEAARARRNVRLVVIDPRRTETAERADLHLAIRGGSDLALFRGLLAWLAAQGEIDHDYLARHVETPEGFWDDLATGGGLEATAEACDVPDDALLAFFGMVAAYPRVLTMFSQGVNQSVRGTDTANAIINIHLATGRIGKPGSGPFSITGQPNAMGGREVGGLASSLAAHMDFAPQNVDRVGRFWNAPYIATKPGLKAVDMFRAVGDGRIKAIWIMATNPAVSMPAAAGVRAALAACPFVVVSDVMAATDTAAFAHVRLPAAAWGEKDGTVTNSERRVSRQRPFFDLPVEAMPDWWMIAAVAGRMGFGPSFAWKNPAAIFREHCALTAFENDGARLLDMGAWADTSDQDYEAMEPWRWGGEHTFDDGQYVHANGKASLVATAPPDLAQQPLMLNTGRYRDQWHTMTRTGLSPRLSQHRREPLVEVHPADADRLGLTDGHLARVTTASGAALYRVSVTDTQRQGEIFAPIHWTDQTSSGGRTGLLPGEQVDPHSGQPGFKLTAVDVEPAPMAWTGFLISRHHLSVNPACDWWTRISVSGGELIELSGTGNAQNAEDLLPSGERIEMRDNTHGTRRIAVHANGKLVAALFLTRTGRLPTRDWIIEQLNTDVTGPSLLAARPSSPQPDRGAVVCVCFDVGARTILHAIALDRLTSVEAIGAALQAGTNCGSCRPAIARLLHQERSIAHAAE